MLIAVCPIGVEGRLAQVPCSLLPPPRFFTGGSLVAAGLIVWALSRCWLDFAGGLMMQWLAPFRGAPTYGKQRFDIWV